MTELDQRLEETGAEFRAAGATLPDRSSRDPERRREVRRTVAVVAAVTLAAVVIVAPALWLRSDSGGGPDTGGGQTTTIVPSTTAAEPGTAAVTTATTSEVPVGVSLGEPVAIAAAPGEHLQVVLGVEGVLYASVWSGNPPSFQYQVVRSSDDGTTWETLLEANPAKNEGLVAAGEVVVLVINDHNPDTTAPSSVVSEAPTVFVFDPVTGATSETVLPRPEDPQMEGLPQMEGPPLNEPEGCDMGGYQSSISARAAAAGDRLVVTGSQYLVGTLADGTVICDVYRNLTWTSDDRGATWELHDGPPLGAITWTGTRYVAWSSAAGESPERLVVSADGLDWTTAVATPPIPDDSIPSGTSVFSLGDIVVAWAGVRGPSAQDPAFAEPTGAVIAVSNDDGLTWAISYVEEPVVAAVGIGATYIGLASNEGAPGDPSDDSNSLLTSTDGVNWTQSIDLPGVTLWGPDSLTATEDAIYIHIYTGEGHAEVWRIPVD